MEYPTQRIRELVKECNTTAADIGAAVLQHLEMSEVNCHGIRIVSDDPGHIYVYFGEGNTEALDLIVGTKRGLRRHHVGMTLRGGTDRVNTADGPRERWRERARAALVTLVYIPQHPYHKIIMEKTEQLMAAQARLDKAWADQEK